MDFHARRAELLERLGAGGPAEMTEGTLVVIPSLTFPDEELLKIKGIGYYEERLLFLLLLLREPGLRLVYVTSMRIEEPIVDYYLSFLPPDVEAGHRLYLIALWQPEPRALTVKVLEQQWAQDRLKALAEDAVAVAFNVTPAEEELTARVGAFLYGCPSELSHLGSKSGSRQVAREAGVEVLEGSEDVRDRADLEAAIASLRRARPDATACVVKLNNGFSGQGNAIIELQGEAWDLDSAPTRFCAASESWDSYLPKLASDGGVVEELVRTPGVVSPSVQLRIGLDGGVEPLSTHDQILGGLEDQVYLGCRFPADPAYRMQIQELGGRVAKVLATKGVVGSFGIDFLVVPEDDDPARIYLSEINLRMGGTTHPFLMAKHVTGGTYDLATGELIVDGRPRCYVGTDNIYSESYIGLLPEDVIAAVDRAGLAYDRATATGITLHLLGALKRFGKMGAVCIASDHAEAESLQAELLRVVSSLASAK